MSLNFHGRHSLAKSFVSATRSLKDSEAALEKAKADLAAAEAVMESVREEILAEIPAAAPAVNMFLGTEKVEGRNDTFVVFVRATAAIGQYRSKGNLDVKIEQFQISV